MLEINSSLVLNYILPGNNPKTTQRDPWIKLPKLQDYLPFKYLHAKNHEVQMIKEPCNLKTEFYEKLKNSILSPFWALFADFNTKRNFSGKSVSATFFCY